MNCREGCGACCIAPSISSPLPGMPDGKPAGVRCFNLNAANLCAIFGQPDRPAVCGAFQADEEVCGGSQEEAIRLIGWWEQMTSAA
ncbi:MAG: YkgJ family cysteine cluster protein [Pseudomonas sp.]|nr:YkgJ family cysteine cluster protein [Pseudomonas sp.]